MEPWQKLLEGYGLPLTILVAAGYLVRKDFIIPWRDKWLVRATAFFDRLDGLLNVAEGLIRAVRDDMRENSSDTKKVLELCQRIWSEVCRGTNPTGSGVWNSPMPQRLPAAPPPPAAER